MGLRLDELRVRLRCRFLCLRFHGAAWTMAAPRIRIVALPDIMKSVTRFRTLVAVVVEVAGASSELRLFRTKWAMLWTLPVPAAEVAIDRRFSIVVSGPLLDSGVLVMPTGMIRLGGMPLLLTMRRTSSWPARSVKLQPIGLVELMMARATSRNRLKLGALVRTLVVLRLVWTRGLKAGELPSSRVTLLFGIDRKLASIESLIVRKGMLMTLLSDRLAHVTCELLKLAMLLLPKLTCGTAWVSVTRLTRVRCRPLCEACRSPRPTMRVFDLLGALLG